MDQEHDTTTPPTLIAADTMHGDLMQLVIDELKAASDPWHRLGETEQADVIDRVRRRTADAVEQVVEQIATQGFTRLRAKIDSLTVKDGIKCVLTASQHDPQRHLLFDAQGAGVFIVLADAEAFTGGANDIKPDPDQGALVLGAIDKIGKSTKDTPAADNGAAGSAQA